ncbi:hypothetical protein HYR99_35475 [Candidatus Poribacteria bacterium]|nr:hypothetical protein [Candidatus Poribacteria bacterium]
MYWYVPNAPISRFRQAQPGGSGLKAQVHWKWTITRFSRLETTSAFSLRIDSQAFLTGSV